ncbi:MAG: metallopeptidase family protein [Mycobacteriales bacterium]
MVNVPAEQFAELVVDAIDSLPPKFTKLMDNVTIHVDDDSPPGGLYGLYEGIPLTARNNNYAMALPDRITLYRQTINDRCADEAEVRRRVEVTVVHEVAHHFGIDDHTLHELGWA